jgi:hypothetical protein
MNDTLKTPGVGARLYELFGSYGFACLLLGFLFVLTFLGTIEQTEHGLYEVQKKYFESLWLVHWVYGVVPLPLPGVYLVMILLTVNLVIGGLIRIRKSSATAGVIVIHLGILLMFAAGLVKMEFSNDGYLQLYERETADDYSSHFEWEVAIWDSAQNTNVKEHLIPGEDFIGLAGDKKRTFESKDLPFKLELAHYEKNAMVLPKGPNWQSPWPVIDGYAVRVLQPNKEAEANVATIFMKANGQDHILWGAAVHPSIVDAGGKKWAVALRKKRFKMPYSITLDKFTHEYYPNTRTPKVYKSDVTVSGQGGQRGAKIEMNQPLREGGLIVFQSSWGPEGAPAGTPLYSGFAVVKNPSDKWPLWSCIVIAIGMVIAFGQKLVRYIQVQKHERAQVDKKGATA